MANWSQGKASRWSARVRWRRGCTLDAGEKVELFEQAEGRIWHLFVPVARHHFGYTAVHLKTTIFKLDSFGHEDEPHRNIYEAELFLQNYTAIVRYASSFANSRRT